jgi:hypothetical protein
VQEDPTLFFDSDENFHVIVHAYPQVGCKEYNCVVSGHGFSADGFKWYWSATPPFSSKVVHKNGSTQNYATRERPFLFVENGKPTALFTSVTLEGRPKQKVGVDYSFTLMQPVGAE